MKILNFESEEEKKEPIIDDYDSPLKLFQSKREIKPTLTSTDDEDDGLIGRLSLSIKKAFFVRDKDIRPSPEQEEFHLIENDEIPEIIFTIDKSFEQIVTEQGFLF